MVDTGSFTNFSQYDIQKSPDAGVIVNKNDTIPVQYTPPVQQTEGKPPLRQPPSQQTPAVNISEETKRRIGTLIGNPEGIAELALKAITSAIGTQEDRTNIDLAYASIYESTGGPERYLARESDRVIAEIAMNSPDPEEVLNRYDASKIIGAALNVAPITVFNHFDEYVQIFSDKVDDISVKTNTKAIVDSFIAGVKMIQYGWAGAAAYVNPAKEKDAQAIYSEIQSLLKDNKQRNFLINGLKIVAQALPYTVYFAGTTLATATVASAIASPVGGAAIATASVVNKLKMLGAILSLIDLAHQTTVMTGMAYMDMRQNGVDQNTARLIAPIDGAIQAVIERYAAGLTKKAANALRTPGTKAAIAKRVNAKLYASGAYEKVFPSIVKQMGKDAFSEAILNELPQGIVDGFSKMIAESISEELGYDIVDKTTIEDIAGNAGNDIVGALLVAPIVSLPVSALARMNDVKNAKDFVEKAKVLSRDQAIQYAEAKGLFASKEDAGAVWDEVRVQAAKQQASHVVPAATGTGTPPQQQQVTSAQQQTVRRTEQGSLPYSSTVYNVNDATQYVEYSFGDTKNEYGTVNATINTDTKTIAITSAIAEAGYDSYAKEMVATIVAENPGYKITVDNDAVVSGFESATDAILKGEPILPEIASLSTEGKTKFLSQLQDAGIVDPLHQSIAGVLLDSISASTGKSIQDMLSVLTIKGVENIEQGNVGAFRAIKENTEYIIEIAKTGNFATLVHELGHFAFEYAMAPEMKKNFEAEYGVQDGIWTDEAKERFVDDYMEYLQTGEAKTPTKKNVFDIIKKILSDLWRKGLHKIKMKKSTRELFEKYFPLDYGKPVVSQEQTIESVEEEKPITKADIVTHIQNTYNISFTERDYDSLAALYAKKNDAVSKYKLESLQDGSVNMQHIYDYLTNIKGITVTDAAKITTVEERIVFDIDTVLKEMGETSDTTALYMKKSDIIAHYAVTKEELYKDAMSYDTFEAFVDSFNKVFTNDELRSLKEIYDYIHSGKTGSKPGTIANKIVADIDGFISNLADAYSNDIGNITEYVNSSPLLSRIVDLELSGEKISATEKKELARYIRAREPLFKAIYGQITNDETLRVEGLSELFAITPAKREVATRVPGLSAGEQAAIMKITIDKAMRQKIKDKKFTISDLNTLLALVETEQLQEKAKRRTMRDKERARAMIKKTKKVMKDLEKLLEKSPELAPTSEYYKAYRIAQNAISAVFNGATVDTNKLEERLTAVLNDSDRSMVQGVVLAVTIAENLGNEKTYESLKIAADSLARIENKGKEARREAKRAFNTEIAIRRSRIIQELKDTVKAPILNYGTDERRRHIDKLNKKYAFIKTINIDRFSDIFLGKRSYETLFEDMIVNFSNKAKHKFRRTKDVLKMLSDKHLERSLQKTVTIDGVAGVTKHAITVQKWDLLGAHLLIGDSKQNENRKQVVAYVGGVLFTEQEKAILKDQLQQKFLKENGLTIDQVEAKALNEYVNEQVEKIIDERADIVRKAVAEFLTDDERALGEKIAEVMNNDEDFSRFADAVYNATGRAVKKERNYFTIQHVGGALYGEDSINDLLADASFGEAAMNMGISIDRKNVQFFNQRALNTHALDVFLNTIEHQEHIANMAMYLKKIRSIFGGASSESRLIRSYIEAKLGTVGLDYIDGYMRALAMGGDVRDKTDGALTKMFRGGYVMGRLAWKLTSIMFQLLSSPLPFMQELNFFEMAKAYTTFFARVAKGESIIDIFNDIEGKSGVLKERQIDFIHEVNIAKSQKALGNLITKIGEAGMMPFWAVDRFAVDFGWLGVYEKKKKKLLEEAIEKNNGNVSLKQQEEIEAQSITYADTFVTRTQPNSNIVFKSPMFHNMTFFKRMALLFQAPLNVVFQNVVFDTYRSFRDKQIGKALRILTSYALMGMLYGFIKAIRLRSKDKPAFDKDDEEKMLTYYLWAASSQFTDMIPYIGNALSNATYSLAMDRPYLEQGTDLYPIADITIGNAVEISKKLANEDDVTMDVIKGAAEYISFSYGLPIDGATELYNISKMLYNDITGE